MPTITAQLQDNSTHVVEYKNGDVVEVNIEDIDVDGATNVRKHIDLKDVADLAEDIRQNDLLSYPTISVKDEETQKAQAEQGVGDPDKPYLLRIGFRRLRALLLLHESDPTLYATVPCRITTENEETIAFQQMSENLKRESLKVDETLEALKKFLAAKEDGGFGLDSKTVCARLGVKDAWLKQRVSFAEHAHPELKSAVDAGDMPFNQAYKFFTDLGGASTAKAVKTKDKPTTDADKQKIKEASKRWKLQAEAVQAAKERVEKYREQIAQKGEKPSKKTEAKVRNRALDEAAARAKRSQTSFYSDEADYLILETHKRTRDLSTEDVEEARRAAAYHLGVRDLLLQLTGASGAFNVFGLYGVEFTPVQKAAAAPPSVASASADANTSGAVDTSEGRDDDEPAEEPGTAPAPKAATRVVLKPAVKKLAPVAAPEKRSPGRPRKVVTAASSAAAASDDAEGDESPKS